MTERIECSNSRAHQRGGFDIAERFRDVGQRFHGRHHEFLIASVVADTANLPVRAVHEIPSPAGETSAVLSAMPADADSLTLLPLFHAGSNLIDHADYLVSRHTRVRDTGKEALLRDYIAVAHS